MRLIRELTIFVKGEQEALNMLMVHCLGVTSQFYTIIQGCARRKTDEGSPVLKAAQHMICMKKL